jgi:nucleoside 2-deoxyribosyltransferase
MSRIEHLASGETFIYIASRVFDYAEKLKTEYLDIVVTRGSLRAMHEVGILTHSQAPITFVPFRDTIQKHSSSPIATDSKASELTRLIYIQDIERLHRLFALVSFFDGLSKDEGICFEIGYAFGIGKPIVLVISDFIRAEYKGIPGPAC